MTDNKKKYVVRAYYADPHKKDYSKMISGNNLVLCICKYILNIFYDYVDVTIKYV